MRSIERAFLPDRRRGVAVHLAVQHHLVVLQLCDDLADASDHVVDLLGLALAGRRRVYCPLLATLAQPLP